MRYTVIDKTQWKPFFDKMSRTVLGQMVELEVASLNVGDQIEEEWSPIVGFSYDPRDNKIYVFTSDLEHSIQDPIEVLLAEENGEIKSICIESDDGILQIVQFREPLRLEAPKANQGPHALL